jgi:DNA-binding XRE family transcriptional regulator
MKQYKIHEDDVDQLLKIRRYLIGFRKTNGWTQGHLATLLATGDNLGWVYDLESNVSWHWRFSRLQSWPEPFGLRLKARLAFKGRSLGAQIHRDPEVAPLYNMARQGHGDWKTWQRAYLTSGLRVARRLKGISSDRMGQILGCSRGAVNSWECESDEVMLPKILHHARALDGTVQLGLEDQ